MGCAPSFERTEAKFGTWFYSYDEWCEFLKRESAETPPREIKHNNREYTVLQYEVYLSEDFLSFGRRLVVTADKANPQAGTTFEGMDLFFRGRHPGSQNGRVVTLHHAEIAKGFKVGGGSESTLRVVFTDSEALGQVFVPIPAGQEAAADRAVAYWKKEELLQPYYHEGREVVDWKTFCLEMMVMDMMMTVALCMMIDAAMMDYDPYGMDAGGDMGGDEGGMGLMDLLL